MICVPKVQSKKVRRVRTRGTFTAWGRKSWVKLIKGPRSAEWVTSITWSSSELNLWAGTYRSSQRHPKNFRQRQDGIRISDSVLKCWGSQTRRRASRQCRKMCNCTSLRRICASSTSRTRSWPLIQVWSPSSSRTPSMQGSRCRQRKK